MLKGKQIFAVAVLSPLLLLAIAAKFVEHGFAGGLVSLGLTMAVSAVVAWLVVWAFDA